MVRTHANAAKAIGGNQVHGFEDAGIEYVVLKVVPGDSEFWSEVLAGNNGMYPVTVVEKQAMGQDVKANADA